MRILFVTSNRLGDAVLSTGILDHLIHTFPNASITVACGPVAAGLFEHMPNRAATIVLTKRRWGMHWLSLWTYAVTRFWDLVVDIRGSALSWLVPTRRRAVFRRTTGPKVAQLATILNIAPPPLPVAWIAREDRRKVAALLPADRPIIVLAPTANWQPKTWPADRFAAVFDRLAASLVPGAVAVILGGPGATERNMSAPLLAALPQAIDLVGTLSLPQVAAVTERATLFIGNDSGLMHLSAAAGAPTIGLFGPTDAKTYAPAGRRAAAVVAASMEAITVDQVVTAARAMLAATQVDVVI